MGETKPLASLSSVLLARKGEARPAMRPQHHSPTYGMPGDELGWNDMGAVPPVLSERAALVREISRTRTLRDAAEARTKKASGSSKTAFTLRLDPERHLQLRMASAVASLSAQTLMTTALDALLETMPDVSRLIEKIPDEAEAKEAST